jgi:hypothetical protein
MPECKCNAAFGLPRDSEVEGLNFFRHLQLHGRAASFFRSSDKCCRYVCRARATVFESFQIRLAACSSRQSHGERYCRASEEGWSQPFARYFAMAITS